MTGEARGSQTEVGWKGTAALMGFGLLAAIGFCELVVRFVMPMPPALSWLRPDGLVLHKPGMRATFFRQEYRTDVAINRLGLRGPEVAGEKAPGTLRLLVVGDSYAEGLQVPWEDLLSTRLERRLNDDPGPTVEVINAGVSGYGTADELLLLEKLGWSLKPDLVLIAFCIHNDVGNNLERPLYDFSTQPPRRLEAPPPSSASFAVLRTKEFLSRHSQLYQLVRDRTAGLRGDDLTLKLGVRRPGGNAVAGGGPRRGGLDYTSWFSESQPRELARGLEYTRQIIRRIRDEGGDTGARVMAVWIPIRDQVSDKRWESLQGKLGLSPASRTRPQELLNAMASALGIESVDLLPVFRASSERDALYFEIDGHWTAAGHRVAAEAVARSLRSWREEASTAGSRSPLSSAS
jgi:lysophospholipase L1-like esterase